MLTNTMKADPKEARRLMGAIAYNCCAAQTPVGDLYRRVVEHVDRPRRAGQPDSWQATVQKSSTALSQAFARQGLSLMAPLFYFHGTGMAMRHAKDWQCGVVSMGIVAAVDLLTRPFGRRTTVHVLAAILVLSWPLREGIRFVGIAGVLALGASGGLLGIAVGSTKHLKALAAGPVQLDVVTKEVKRAWGEFEVNLKTLEATEIRAVELVEKRVQRRLSVDEITLTKNTLAAWIKERTAADHARNRVESRRLMDRLWAEPRRAPSGKDSIAGALDRF